MSVTSRRASLHRHTLRYGCDLSKLDTYKTATAGAVAFPVVPSVALVLVSLIVLRCQVTTIILKDINCKSEATRAPGAQAATGSQ